MAAFHSPLPSDHIAILPPLLQPLVDFSANASLTILAPNNITLSVVHEAWPEAQTLVTSQVRIGGRGRGRERMEGCACTQTDCLCSYAVCMYSHTAAGFVERESVFRPKPRGVPRACAAAGAPGTRPSVARWSAFLFCFCAL